MTKVNTKPHFEGQSNLKVSMNEKKKTSSNTMRSMFDSPSPIPSVQKMNFSKKSTLNSSNKITSMNQFKEKNYIPDYKTFSEKLPDELFFREETFERLPDNPIQLIKMKKARDKVISNFAMKNKLKIKEINDPVNLKEASKLRDKQENLIRDINSKEANLNSLKFDLNHLLDNHFQASNFN